MTWKEFHDWVLFHPYLTGGTIFVGVLLVCRLTLRWRWPDFGEVLRLTAALFAICTTGSCFFDEYPKPPSAADFPRLLGFLAVIWYAVSDVKKLASDLATVKAELPKTSRKARSKAKPPKGAPAP